MVKPCSVCFLGGHIGRLPEDPFGVVRRGKVTHLARSLVWNTLPHTWLPHFQTHSLFVIPIKSKQWRFKWDLWFLLLLFIALGFMGALYRLAHLRVCQINKRRKEQPILTVLIFCCLSGNFLIVEVHLFNYSEYNLFNVQRLCVLGPIILIAHGCLHRHMRSHMRLFLCFSRF